MINDKLVEFKAPKELVDDFDETAERVGFGSRAETLRKLMREFIEKNKVEA